MTILNKLFRATAFKLTLVIFGLSVVGSAVVLGVVAWQVIKLVDSTLEPVLQRLPEGMQTILLQAREARDELRTRVFGSSA